MAEEKRRPDRSSNLRQRADEMLLKQPRRTDKIPPPDVKRIIHELEVHQIELELQNDELRRTQRDLEAAREKYFDLYDLAPVGYLFLNEKGLIMETNLTAATLLGKERRDLVSQPLTRFIFGEDQDIYYLHHKRLYETCRRQECRVRMLKGDGTHLWVRVESVVVRGNNDEPASRTIIIDIAGPKKVQEALKKAHDELELRAQERICHQNIVLEGINRIFREAHTCDTEEELGRACLSVAEEVTQSKFGFIGEIGPDGFLHDIAISDPGWELCTMYDKSGHRRPPGDFKIHGLYGRVLLDGKSFFANEPSLHPDSIGTPEGHPPLKAFLGIPLIFGDKTIGIVGVGNREGGYRGEDLEALENVGSAIIQVFMRKRAEEALKRAHDVLELQVLQRTSELLITNENLFAQLEERKRAEDKISRLNRLYSVLSKVNETIVRIHDSQELFNEVCRIAVEDGLFKMAWIGLIDPDSRIVKPIASYQDTNGYLNNVKVYAADVPEGKGPTGAACFEGKYSICGDIEQDPRMLPWREKALRHGLRSSSAFPIHAGSSVIGALTVYSGKSHFFNDKEIQLLTSLAEDGGTIKKCVNRKQAVYPKS